MVDLLVLSSLLSQQDHKDPLLEGKVEEAVDLHTTWSKLYSSLKHSLTILPSHDSSLLMSVLELLTRNGHEVPSFPSSVSYKDTPNQQTHERRMLFTLVCKKISEAMKEVVGLVSRDQLNEMLESLLCEVCLDTQSFCSFCDVHYLILMVLWPLMIS